jgi:hypothetical protein
MNEDSDNQIDSGSNKKKKDKSSLDEEVREIPGIIH